MLKGGADFRRENNIEKGHNNSVERLENYFEACKYN